MKYEIDEQLLRATMILVESRPISEAVGLWQKLKQVLDNPIEDKQPDKE